MNKKKKKSLFQPNLDKLITYNCTTMEMDQRLFLWDVGAKNKLVREVTHKTATYGGVGNQGENFRVVVTQALPIESTL